MKHEVHRQAPTSDVVKKQLQTAYSTFKWLKAQSDWQDTWLGLMIAAQAEAWGCTWAQLWKQVRMTKKVWKMARMVKHTLGLCENWQGLTQVMDPSRSHTPGVFYTTKAQVEQACLEEAG